MGEKKSRLQHGEGGKVTDLGEKYGMMEIAAFPCIGVSVLLVYGVISFDHF